MAVETAQRFALYDAQAEVESHPNQQPEDDHSGDQTTNAAHRLRAW